MGHLIATFIISLMAGADLVELASWASDPSCSTYSMSFSWRSKLGQTGQITLQDRRWSCFNQGVTCFSSSDLTVWPATWINRNILPFSDQSLFSTLTHRRRNDGNTDHHILYQLWASWSHITVPTLFWKRDKPTQVLLARASIWWALQAYVFNEWITNMS